jgi:hypothetical protein
LRILEDFRWGELWEGIGIETRLLSTGSDDKGEWELGAELGAEDESDMGDELSSKVGREAECVGVISETGWGRTKLWFYGEAELGKEEWKNGKKDSWKTTSLEMKMECVWRSKTL